MNKTNDKFVIPQKNISIIAELKNNLIKEIGKIDIPYLSKNIFSKNRLFVSLCFGTKLKSRRLKIYNEFGNQLLKNTEFKFDSINCKDNTVYLGGQYNEKNGELFYFIDLSDNKFKLQKVELPIKSMKGKSIDDILIRNNTLYLVDNMVFPKYIFKYDIDTSINPKYIETYELESNGTYEHIIKGCINENWTALFSSTVGRDGAFHHISIIEKDEDRKKNNVLTFLIETVFQESNKDYYKILDICLIKNKLIILKENGLFFIDLTGEIKESNILKINDNTNNYNKLLSIAKENYIILNNEKYELLIL